MNGAMSNTAAAIAAGALSLASTSALAGDVRLMVSPLSVEEAVSEKRAARVWQMLLVEIELMPGIVVGEAPWGDPLPPTCFDAGPCALPSLSGGQLVAGRLLLDPAGSRLDLVLHDGRSIARTATAVVPDGPAEAVEVVTKTVHSLFASGAPDPSLVVGGAPAVSSVADVVSLGEGATDDDLPEPEAPESDAVAAADDLGMDDEITFDPPAPTPLAAVAPAVAPEPAVAPIEALDPELDLDLDPEDLAVSDVVDIEPIEEPTRAERRERRPPPERRAASPLRLPELTVAGRVGHSRYYTLPFLTGGVEVGAAVAGRLFAVGGAEMFAVRRHPSGEAARWNTVSPVNAGLLYRAPAGTWRPYVGGDLLTVRHYRAEGETGWAFGARARGGVDWMWTDRLAFTANLAVGAWTSPTLSLVEPGVGDTGLLPQASAGITFVP